MKNFILLISIILFGCTKTENPYKYKDCVVVDKTDGGNYIQIKLTDSLAKEYNCDGLIL